MKTRPRLEPKIPIHRVTRDGVTLPTTAQLYPLKGTRQPGDLYCECNHRSVVIEWGDGQMPNEIGPRCPVCRLQYELDEPLPDDVAEAPAATVPQLSPDEQLARERQRVEAEQAAKAAEAPPIEPPLTVSIDGEGLATDGRTRTVLQLNDEWLDLSLRLELLDDEKHKFLDQWKADCSAVLKRINQLKAEMRALKAGDTYIPEPDPPKPEPKQPKLPGMS